MNSAQHKICSAKSNCGSHMSLLLHNYFWGTVKDRSSGTITPNPPPPFGRIDFCPPWHSAASLPMGGNCFDSSLRACDASEEHFFPVSVHSYPIIALFSARRTLLFTLRASGQDWLFFCASPPTSQPPDGFWPRAPADI